MGGNSLVDDLDGVLHLSVDVDTGLDRGVGSLTQDLPCQPVQLLECVGGQGGRAGRPLLLPSHLEDAIERGERLRERARQPEEQLFHLASDDVGIIHGDVLRDVSHDQRGELGEDARVIATGGLAQRIAAESKTLERVEPFLTLEGLRMLYEKNRTASEAAAKE